MDHGIETAEAEVHKKGLLPRQNGGGTRDGMMKMLRNITKFLKKKST